LRRSAPSVLVIDVRATARSTATGTGEGSTRLRPAANRRVVGATGRIEHGPTSGQEPRARDRASCAVEAWVSLRLDYGSCRVNTEHDDSFSPRRGVPRRVHCEPALAISCSCRGRALDRLPPPASAPLRIPVTPILACSSARDLSGRGVHDRVFMRTRGCDAIVDEWTTRDQRVTQSRLPSRTC
jgi:hypothetical protein